MARGDRGTIFITGSHGRIGRAVRARLGAAYRVVGARSQPPSTPTPDTVVLDLASDKSVRAGLDLLRREYGSRLTSVIHLAAFYDLSGEDDPRYEEINVRGTERLLQELQAFEVEQFLFASTMIVHAPCAPGERIAEASPLEPKWPYPQSKLAAEQLLQERRGGIPVVLARLANVYDEGCHHPLLAHQIQRIYEHRLTGHLFPGDASHGHTYLHLEDLADAVCRLVERRNDLPPVLPLLLGEPEPVPYGEIQKRVGEALFGQEWKTLEIPKPVAAVGAWLQEQTPLEVDDFVKPWMVRQADDHYALDISRARMLLDWEPVHSLPEILPPMVEALKRDPRAWYRENGLDSTAPAPSPPPGTQ